MESDKDFIGPWSDSKRPSFGAKFEGFCLRYFVEKQMKRPRFERYRYDNG
jgi:hypothetical protein